MDILTHPFMGMVILSPLSSPLDLGSCTTTPPMLANHHTRYKGANYANVFIRKINNVSSFPDCSEISTIIGVLTITSIVSSNIIKDMTRYYEIFFFPVPCLVTFDCIFFCVEIIGHLRCVNGVVSEYKLWCGLSGK